MTTEEGLRDGEDCYEELHSLGARAFAIWGEDGELVFDSGSDFERITAALLPENLNSDNSEANLEGRSDNKGPEPENVTVAAGDLGPEGLIVIDADDSPVAGTPLLVVANEVSGTVTMFTIGTRPFAFDRGIGAACPGSFPAAFDDIAGNTHEDAIRCAAAAGLTQGTSDPSLYGPAGTVPRGQMAAFIQRFIEAASGEELPAGDNAFADDDSSVHAAAIDALAAAGVFTGRDDGTSAPGAPVSRGQMVSLLDRALDVIDDGERNDSYPPRTDEDLFTDDDGSAHEAAVGRLGRQGVVAGYTDGTFRPATAVRRDQVASSLLRAMDLAVTDGLADPVE